MHNKQWNLLAGIVFAILALLVITNETFAQFQTTEPNGQVEQNQTYPPPDDTPPDGPRDGGRHGMLDVVAETLNMTVADLVAELNDETSIADVATAHGVAVETVIDAVVADAQEHLQQHVTDGKLTQEEADERLAQIREEVTTRINETGTPSAPRDHGPRDGGRHGMLDVVAEALNMTMADLVAELNDETSIADVATAHGVAVETVIDAVVADAQEHLQQHVTDGKLTQEEADERLAQIREEVTTRINEAGTPSAPRDHGPRDGGRHGMLDVVAETLNMTVEDLVAELNDETSIADVATAHGVAVETVIDAVVADAEEHLQQHVDDGRITQEQADERLAQIREEVTTRINEAGAPLAPRDHGPRPTGPQNENSPMPLNG
ncbi:MAG: hypothetical protein HC837_04760 [Chloroflexaceae bacterium]|nr:hypothetical protein [Chloroflexaceae bacterium]